MTTVYAPPGKLSVLPPRSSVAQKLNLNPRGGNKFLAETVYTRGVGVQGEGSVGCELTGCFKSLPFLYCLHRQSPQPFLHARVCSDQTKDRRMPRRRQVRR